MSRRDSRGRVYNERHNDRRGRDDDWDRRAADGWNQYHDGKVPRVIRRESHHRSRSPSQRHRRHVHPSSVEGYHKNDKSVKPESSRTEPSKPCAASPMERPDDAVEDRSLKSVETDRIVTPKQDYRSSSSVNEEVIPRKVSQKRRTSPSSCDYGKLSNSKKQKVQRTEDAFVDTGERVGRLRRTGHLASSDESDSTGEQIENRRGRRRVVWDDEDDNEKNNGIQNNKDEAVHRSCSKKGREEEEKTEPVLQDTEKLEGSDQLTLLKDVDGKQKVTKMTKRTKGKQSAETSFLICRKQDISQHDSNCYVCDVPVRQNDTSTKDAMRCDSCLRSYHMHCQNAFQNLTPSDKWICSVCRDDPPVRTLEFSRNGKWKSADPNSSIEEYSRDVCGLTGYTDGCGKCGNPSSQRRIAVLCDNCDREWHIGCMAVETEEVPWGNWLCPNCQEMCICTSCVLAARSALNNRSSGDDGADDDVAESAKKSTDAIQYYHEGRLLKCLNCYLKYHYDCVQHAVPLHLKYSWDELAAAHEMNFAQLSNATNGVSNDAPTTDSNEERPPLSFKSYLHQVGLSRTKDEPWCCPQCQDYHGIQQIVTQRRWMNPIGAASSEGGSHKPEQIQLLVKFRGLSYRTLQWLPADRVKILYPAGFRKWQTSASAARLLQTSSNHVEEEVSQSEESEDEQDSDNEKSDGVKQNNSSSVQKVEHQKFDWFMRRPPGVKVDWFRPCRVLSRRRCPRGSSRNEYLVRWSSLSYQEVSWERLSVVQNTRALRVFEAADCLERILFERPPSISRDPLGDPTVTDVQLSSDTPLPLGASLVPGRKYLIRTTGSQKSTQQSSSNQQSETSSAGNDFLSDDPTAPSSSPILSAAVAPIDTLPPLEQRERDFRRGLFIPYVDRPKFLNGHFLFDYQLDGVNWLRFAWTRRRSVILADEMGLGKTVQVISFLGSLWNDFATQGPFLIIAPLATLEDVWMREFGHWAPFINVVSYSGNPEARQTCRELELFHTTPADGDTEQWLQSCFGNELKREYDRKLIRPRLPKLANSKRFAKFDALVTSYEIFRKDHWLFQQIDWKVIIVDEGHRLKSFSSEVKRALESCKSEMRLLLTGTPLQNSIDELFSLLNVLHPEKFPEGCKEDFQDVTQQATIEKLKAELKPHILRRIKKDVMGGKMPTKKERVLRVENSAAQKEIYRNIILRNHVILGSACPSTSTVQKKTTRVTSLRNIVMQMRKCCNHPYLFEDVLPVIKTEEDFNDLVESSGKLSLLDRMLSLLSKEGHRVLLFSQFMRMLDILEEYLSYRHYGYERLDGSTSAPERQKAIDRFNTQPQRKFVFLLSTRAGGLGINLTSADTVIIFDSDWNPHNDLQAQARAHRLGQTKKVAIFRFMTRASVEERIIEIARNKLVLDQVVAGRLDPRDAEAVVRCGAKELFDDAAAAREVSYDDDQLKTILSRDETSMDENESEEKTVDGTTEKGGVLDAFKVAHFEEHADDSVPDIEDESQVEKFWSELLKDEASEGIEQNFVDDGELGRGMRARKEVSYFGQEKFGSMEDALQSDGGKAEARVKSNLSDFAEDEPASYDAEYAEPENAAEKKKNSKKKRKSATNLEGTTALLFYRNDESVSLHGIVSENDSSCLDKFRTTCKVAIINLIRQTRSVRRSLGLSDEPKLPKLPELKLEGRENGIAVVEQLMTVVAGSFEAFGLQWDDIWLGHLATLHSNLPKDQTYIITHSDRYFLISHPIEPIPSSPHLIAVLREISADEFSSWKSRVSVCSLRCTEGVRASTKTTPKTTAGVQWPDISTLREYLNTRDENHENDEIDDAIETDAILEQIWNTTCQCCRLNDVKISGSCF